MIAYDILGLNNLFIREQSAEAFHQNSLDKEALDNINSKYPEYFYTPNFFIRIGLFILTLIILLFSFGLFMLLFLDSIEHAIGGLAIFFALLSYAALEYMVQKKRHFRSGTDDALLWISAGCLFGGLNYLMNAGALANCLLAFMISLYCALRFADKLMSVILYVSLLGIFFFAITNLAGQAKALVSFVLMAIAVATYLSVKRMLLLTTNQPYKGCLQLISICALLSFYFAGNYYVVRELSNTIFDLNLVQTASIPFGWLFWIFTAATPCIYIVNGVQKKDIVMIRIGLLLTAVNILTVRNYYSLAAIEVMMTLGGLLLIIISYGLMQYLKNAKYGFTSVEINKPDQKVTMAIESLVIAQTFTGQQAPAENNNFGGGSFGGGGASGEF